MSGRHDDEHGYDEHGHGGHGHTHDHTSMVDEAMEASADGTIIEHSDLGARQVLHHRVTMREGKTLYTRLGDGPFVALAVLSLAASVVLRRRERS